MLLHYGAVLFSYGKSMQRSNNKQPRHTQAQSATNTLAKKHESVSTQELWSSQRADRAALRAPGVLYAQPFSQCDHDLRDRSNASLQVILDFAYIYYKHILHRLLKL
jgi:hypothetical protein